MPSINLSDSGGAVREAGRRLPARRRGPDGQRREHRRRAARPPRCGRSPTRCERPRPTIGGAAGEPVELLIGTDQEYGWVTRIKSGLVQLPSAMAFGAAGRPDLTEAAWSGAGQELAAVGINVDFAPDADVHRPARQLRDRLPLVRLPTRPRRRQVAAAVRGLQSAGVAAAIKHFPGHGDTTVNSHVALPVLTPEPGRARDARDLAPFRSGHRGRVVDGDVRAPGRAGDRSRTAGELLQQGADRPAARRAAVSPASWSPTR